MSDFSPDAVVENLYREILRRRADPDGKKHFVNLINNGASSSDVANALKNSSEYQFRFPATHPREGKRVLYFTIVDLGRLDNGGSLVCRNHARRIAETDGIDLTICTFGSASDHQVIERDFAHSIGASYHPINPKSAPNRRHSHWPFSHEIRSENQDHVDGEVSELIEILNPELLIVDYFYSALYIPSVFRRSSLRRILITLNREGEFYRNLRKQNALPPDASNSLIAEVRLRILEQRVYSQSDTIVALCREDLPIPWPGVRRRIVRPIFDQRPLRWRGSENRNVFFVGNILHGPNRQAINWIASKLSPALMNVDPSICIDIIGANAEQTGNEGKSANLRFHGPSTMEHTVDLFISCGLFIAPIENAWGSKIKLLDCIAYGTPFLASKAALSGIPSVEGPEIIDLNDPAGTAKALAASINSPQARISMSQSIVSSSVVQMKEQADNWRSVLFADH